MNIPNLRVLDLSSNCIGVSTGLSELCALGLEQLNLQKNQIAEVNTLVRLHSQNLNLRLSLSIFDTN